MARSTGDDKKTEVVQTRVAADIKANLEDQLDDGQTLADYVREILTSVTGDDADEGASVKTALLCDLYTLSTTVGDQDSLHTVLTDNWDQLVDDRDQIRSPVLDTTGTVYLAGQGSSFAIAAWLTSRLTDRRVDAAVHAAEDVPVSALDEDDTVILLSYSGQTESICRLADHAIDKGATVIGASAQSFATEQELDHRISLPPVEERVQHYATRSAILQLAVLHTVLLADDPGRDAVQQVCDHVEQFIQTQLASAPADPGEDDPEPPAIQAVIEVDDRQYFLNPDSPFMRAAAALSQEGDLGDDPVFASLGPWHQLSWLGVQSHTEFLHTNATHVNLASVRDAVLNVLYRGNAILVTTLPLADDAADGPYRRALQYLFRSDSIDELLRLNLSKPGNLRLFAFTFNDPDDLVENEIRLRSLYREDSLIQLPDPEDTLDIDEDTDGEDDRMELAQDLTVATAHYLFVYAILEKRWTQDRQLREEVIRGPEL